MVMTIVMTSLLESETKWGLLQTLLAPNVRLAQAHLVGDGLQLSECLEHVFDFTLARFEWNIADYHLGARLVTS